MTATAAPPIAASQAAVASVIVVSYRTPDLARACVDSVLRAVDMPFHTIVVDTSDGPGVLTDAPTHVWCVYQPNIGYARALAAGIAFGDEIQKSAGFKPSPLVVACNADTEFPADGIAALVALFDEHRDLAILGPRQVTPDGRIAHAGIPAAGDTTGGRDYGAADTGQHAERLLDVEQVSGSVMLIRRQALDAIGGLRDLPRLYFEDALLCRRARGHGWRVAYSGLRTFVHHVAASPDPPDVTRAHLAATASADFHAEITADR